VTHEAKPVVFVVGVDNVAHQREVTLGPEQGGEIEIVSGVKAGENVIRLGQYEIADGARVQAGGKLTADKTETKEDAEKKDGGDKPGASDKDRADSVKETTRKEAAKTAGEKP
jgi:hypothetical protein